MSAVLERTARRRPAGVSQRLARRAAPVGLVAGLVLVAASVLVPRLTGWHVTSQPNDTRWPPLHGVWRPHAGVGTVPALLLAALGVVHGERVARLVGWWRLLVSSYVVGVGWILALAMVDGPEEISGVLGNKDEYLQQARITDLSTVLHVYAARIPVGVPQSWDVHLAGHPPGALLFFVLLVRLGLGGDLVAGLVVVALAATTVPAVLTTLRALGAEHQARSAAPLLVLTPAAMFLGVSADAMFAAVVAWGLAALALAATGRRRAGLRWAGLRWAGLRWAGLRWAGLRWAGLGWAVLAGLLLGYAVMLSYGLPLVGLLALAVLVAARGWWWPLPVAAATALSVVAGFAVAGFAWWSAYPVLDNRYWAGIARTRPASYWLWGDLAALLLTAGPVLAAALAVLATRGRGLLRDADSRVVALLAGGAAVAVLLADASRMSKAEVERIWLPFVPWLTLAVLLLPPRWRRGALLAQVVTALLVQHLVVTQW